MSKHPTTTKELNATDTRDAQAVTSKARTTTKTPKHAAPSPAQPAQQNAAFEIPIGDSGEVLQSFWRFGE